MDDKAILRLYLDRDERAIPAASEKYGCYCTSIAKNILGNSEDAEECVNDTYWNAWNSIPPHTPGVLSAYLGKITRNLALNRYKQKRTDKRGGGELTAVLDELAECVSDRHTLEEELNSRELIKAIDDFLGGLPTKKRNMFICRYWYADSISDIAEQFAMTGSHVSVQLSRTRKQLKAHLLERGFER